MLLVSNTLTRLLRPTRIRLIGLGAGILVGLSAQLFPMARERGPNFTSSAIAAAALPLAALLGWLFAYQAVRPGWRAGLIAAIRVDLAAVCLGSFAVAAQAGLAGGTDPSTLLGVTIGLGLLGLVFLGVPMLALTFLPAVAWVGTVRLELRFLRAFGQ